MSKAPKTLPVDSVGQALNAPVPQSVPNECGVFTRPLEVEFSLPGKAQCTIELARSDRGWYSAASYRVAMASGAYPAVEALPFADRHGAVLHALGAVSRWMESHADKHGDARRAVGTLLKYRREVEGIAKREEAPTARPPVLFTPSQAFTLWGGESPSFPATRWSPPALRIHPLLERITMMPETLERLGKLKVRKPEHDDAAAEIREDWTAFQDDVAANGVLEPLKICLVDGVPHVADGRHRLQAAQAAKLQDVPGILVSEAEALKIIHGTVLARRSWTKGMKAYFGVLMHPEVAGNTRATRGKKASDSIGSPEKDAVSTLTRVELARMCGCSSDTIDQACEIFTHCEKSAKIRKDFEWRVFTGSMGLGGILAGIGAQLAGEEDETLNGRKRPETPWKHLCAGWDKAGRYLTHWDKLSDVQRETAEGALVGMLKQLPDSLRSSAMKALKS